MLMNPKLLSLTLGLALMASTAAPGIAADWNYSGGGLKGSYGGTPVPAPVPIPQYEPEWYLRGDIGYTFSSSGTVSSTFNARDIDATAPADELAVTGIPAGAIDLSDLEGQGVFSFGFGRYVTNNVRLELTGERRLAQKIVAPTTKGTGTIRDEVGRGNDVTDVNPPNNVLGDLVYSDHQFDVSRQERGELSSYMMMANVFYDLDTRYGFRPYVGAGLGLVVHALNRDFVESANCSSTVQYHDGVDDAAVTAVAGQQTVEPCNYAGNQNQSRSGGGDTTGVGLGLSLMTGVGYEVRDGLHWDIGYRYVYQDGNVALTQRTFNGSSLVKVEGRHDHEIRTGIRFDIQ